MLVYISSGKCYPQKLALTSPTGGGRSVGIVRVRTKATEFLGVKCLSFRELIHSNKGLDTVNSDREYLRTPFSSSTHRIPVNKQRTSLKSLTVHRATSLLSTGV